MKFSSNSITLLLPASAVIATATLVSGQVSLQSICYLFVWCSCTYFYLFRILCTACLYGPYCSWTSLNFDSSFFSISSQFTDRLPVPTHGSPAPPTLKATRLVQMAGSTSARRGHLVVSVVRLGLNLV